MQPIPITLKNENVQHLKIQYQVNSFSVNPAITSPEMEPFSRTLKNKFPGVEMIVNGDVAFFVSGMNHAETGNKQNERNEKGNEVLNNSINS